MEIIQNYFKYIIVCIVIIALLGISYLFYYNSSKEVKEEPIVLKKNESNEELNKSETKTSKYIYVDIKGAVKSPNVYMIEEGKRVIDAINLSGGILENADTSIINLSKKLTDEMCIIVYTKEEIEEYRKQGLEDKEISKKLKQNTLWVNDYNDAQINKGNTNKSNNEKSISNEKISINTATKDELLTLSGIGESKAEAIIKYREDNGEFKTIEDIKNVTGIGDALFEKIKDDITI